MLKISDYLVGNISRSIENKAVGRFTYIIGNNGTGKSRLLNHLVEMLNVETGAAPHSILCISNSVFDKFNFFAGGKSIYLGQKTVGNAIFLSLVDRNMIRWACEILQKNRVAYNSVCENFDWSCRIRIGKSSDNPNNIIDWVKSSIDKRKVKKNKNLDNVFSEAELNFLIENIGKSVELPRVSDSGLTCLIKLMNLNCSSVSFTLDKPFGETNDGLSVVSQRETSFSELSSGEQNRLLLAFKIVANFSPGCLILIDEPEISLHLHWQMDFHNFLKKLLPPEQSWHVVVATHSPLIISEAEKDDLTDAVIIIEKFSGANVDDIDYQVSTGVRKQGYDEVVLDYFSTATYKSKAIEEEAALALIDSDDDYFSRKARLEKLLLAKGVADDEMEMLKTALKLLDNHREELCSEQSE